MLRKYQDAIGEPDFVTVTTLELQAQRARPAPVAEAPIFAPAESRPAGLDPILAPLVLLPPAAASRP